MSVAIEAQAQAAVPNPTVQGPIEAGIHGYPWDHSLFPLSAKGYSYTENEYFFGASADNLEKGVSAPYESRTLVRLPTDPAKFNGTMIVEWVNVTGWRRRRRRERLPLLNAAVGAERSACLHGRASASALRPLYRAASRPCFTGARGRQRRRRETVVKA